MTEEEFLLNMQDRKWRINNLYFVKDKKGNKVLFKMNKIQEIIHDNLWFWNIIPKARQLGVTTFFCILYFDQILFSEHKTAGIIAHRQEDMKKIFKNKIRFAWDNLPWFVRRKIGEPNVDNANELTFPNGSTIFVSMSTRSGTINFLHISEFAYVCQKYPEKAEEIVTGAINSVEAGQMVSIESTAAGREGYFFDFCMTAERMRKEGRVLSELDFKLFFFPWWEEPAYQLADANFLIDADHKRYFDLLKVRHGIKLSEGQMRWYIKKHDLNKDKMTSEYPSTLDEAFSVSTEGAYYASDMNKVYLSQRITPIPYDPTLLVDTWWDLGINDDTVILFVQSKGPQIRFIDCYVSHGEGLAHYAQVLKDKKYRYGQHILPWDVEVTDVSTGLSRKTTLYNLGLTDIRVSPKAGILDGIDRVRMLFNRFYFDEQNCTKLYQALGNYRKDFDAKLGVWKSNPRHDENSHVADAVRTGAALWKEQQPEDDYGTYVSTEKDQSFFS